MKKLFYSWQSDIASNKSYLNHCISSAMAQLQGWEPETATRNTRGAVDIANTILMKIDKSNLLLADVSIINPNANEGEKKCPNPNVLYELGYAVATLGQDNLILIANKATTNTADLPFDIRNRRLMLVEFNDANRPTLINDIKQILASYSEPLPVQNTPTITLSNDTGGWANWGGGHMGSGFRYHLHIDNFEGSLNYISLVSATAVDESGNDWQTRFFVFDGHSPNQALKIESNEIKDVGVFLTDEPGQHQKLLPKLDENSVKLKVQLRTGESRLIDIPASRLRNT